MSALRLDVELTTVEPAGEMVYVEGRGADGAQVALYLAASAVRGSSLAAGQRLQLALELPAPPPAALPPLRERMGRAPAATAGAAAPRSTSQLPARAAATAPPRASATAPARDETSAVILSAIFGTSGGEDGVSTRDVEDELDALLGRTKRGQ